MVDKIFARVIPNLANLAPVLAWGKVNKGEGTSKKNARIGFGAIFWHAGGFVKNIARGTTDQGYWVYKLFAKSSHVRVQNKLTKLGDASLKGEQ